MIITVMDLSKYTEEELEVNLQKLSSMSVRVRAEVDKRKMSSFEKMGFKFQNIQVHKKVG